MKKHKICSKCYNIEEEISCDTCGINLSFSYGSPITVEFGYGHTLDGENYHFCSNKCLLEFINNESKK
jgi:hypothetical protein